jgi:NADH/NAD ratio-sensing transcriptional regulator Rex
MEKPRFFKTMPDYKELVILSEIDKNSKTTQKEIAMKCDITPPMVNKYLAILESKGEIEIKGTTTRNTTYHLTPEGKSKLMILNISYSREILTMYKASEKNFEPVWNHLISKKLKKILLFGAGDIGEMALEIMESHGIKIVGFIDENSERIGNKIQRFTIKSVNDLNEIDFDAIVITSYRHGVEMAKRIISKTEKPVFIFFLENGVTYLKLVERANKREGN